MIEILLISRVLCGSVFTLIKISAVNSFTTHSQLADGFAQEYQL